MLNNGRRNGEAEVEMVGLAVAATKYRVVLCVAFLAPDQYLPSDRPSKAAYSINTGEKSLRLRKQTDNLPAQRTKGRKFSDGDTNEDAEVSSL